MKDIVIIGAGGFAREVAWLIEDINREKEEWNLLGFIDENKNNHGKILNGVEVLGDFSWFKNANEIYTVCAVGNPHSKQRMIHKASEIGAKFPILIHPSVLISKHTNIGEGTIICAGNIITTNIEIGKHVIINLDSTIGHDAIIKDYCTILPSVNISGNVIINERVDVGTGSAIIQGIEIGNDTIIGAGSVVVKNLPSNCTAVGIPAKPIKFHK